MEPDVRRLERRVRELEERLAEVEARLGFVSKPSPEPEPEPARPVALPPPLPFPRPEAAPPPPALPPPPREEAPVGAPAAGLETRAGLGWLNVVGAVTMILAAAFGFQAAVDNNWIGPGGRIVCGLVAGAVVLLAGDRLWHRGHQRYAQGVTALGVCLFYLTFTAAFQLYGLVDQRVAFAGVLVTTAAAGALALRYNARVVAILSLLGGYASPFLVSTGESNDPFFGGYLVVLNAVALTLARRKRWLSVELTAALCTFGLHVVWVGMRHGQIGPYLGGAVLAAQFALFAGSPYGGIRWAAAGPAMAGIGMVCGAYSSPVYWIWAAVVAAAGLGLAVYRRDDRLAAAGVAGWVAGYVVWGADWASHGLLMTALTTGFLVYLGALVWLPFGGRTFASYSALTLNALFYYVAAYSAFDRDHHGYMGLLALAVAACYLGAALQARKEQGATGVLVLTAAGVALSFVTLAVPIQLSGYSITLAWAVESAVLAYIAARVRSVWPFAASWVVGALAVGMVLFADSSRAWGASYTPIMNARFVPFVVVTVCLAGNAYWTSRHRGRLAGVPFLLAHFVALVGLHAEVFAAIEARHRPGVDLTSQEAVASTILLALYGFALVAHGIARPFRAHRLLGLTLFALVIGKLYLYDVWQLGLVYKVFAFGGLGALLFSGSFLYSRYRERLIDLVRREDAGGGE